MANNASRPDKTSFSDVLAKQPPIFPVDKINLLGNENILQCDDELLKRWVSADFYLAFYNTTCKMIQNKLSTWMPNPVYRIFGMSADQVRPFFSGHT